jgi:hypothetical protein
MAEQYAHTLIAVPDDFAPIGAQVGAFMAAMLARRVVPGTPSLVLRRPSARTREVLNPITRQVQTVRTMDRRDLTDASEVGDAVGSLGDYEVEASGLGRPRTPPVPLDFRKAYNVAVTCRVSSVLRSTSDAHDDGSTVRYGEPCPDGPTDGLFSDPRTGAVRRVPGAGCARFWVQFELGKFLFPQFGEGDGGMDVLHPTIVEEAGRAFGVPFVQGCYWG